MSNVLILRCSSPTGASYGGFQWPFEVGAVVEAPDWTPTPRCGHGLHGWLWGEGDVGASEYHSDPNAIWHLIEAVEDDVIDLQGTVKFRRGTIVAVGKRDEVIAVLQADPRAAGRAVIYGRASAGRYGTAVTGYGGTAASGFDGILMIHWYNQFRKRIAIGYIGENGLEPNTPYKLDANGNFVKATART
jgi:hypothetical protein